MPGSYRAFLIGLPIAGAAGAPLSTALLGMNGLFNLRGWQIMYLAEGIPTILIGKVTLFVLTDRPEQAKFLAQEEKAWLGRTLDAERKAKEEVRTFIMWESLVDPKVLLLSVNYLGMSLPALACCFSFRRSLSLSALLATWQSVG
jgi:ACS family tartrate transporter-like MFS transporter